MVPVISFPFHFSFISLPPASLLSSRHIPQSPSRFPLPRPTLSRGAIFLPLLPPWVMRPPLQFSKLRTFRREGVNAADCRGRPSTSLPGSSNSPPPRPTSTQATTPCMYPAVDPARTQPPALFAKTWVIWRSSDYSEVIVRRWPKQDLKCWLCPSSKLGNSGHITHPLPLSVSHSTEWLL